MRYFDARVLSGMQVTVQAHVCILTVGCKGGTQLRCWFGIPFAVLVESRKIDGWVKCGAAWGALQGDGAGAFCLIDGRVLFGEFRGVLLEVLVCKHCYLRSMLVYCFNIYI